MGKTGFTCPECKQAEMILVGIIWPQSRAGPTSSRVVKMEHKLLKKTEVTDRENYAKNDENSLKRSKNVAF